MSRDQVTPFLRSLADVRSRRDALGTALGSATLVAADVLTRSSATAAAAASRHHPPPARAAKKRKKRCPAPPPAPFCTGKNTCAEGAPSFCDTGDAQQCGCYIDALNAGPVCAQFTTAPSVASCVMCPAETTCVIQGGVCEGGFRCLPRCPNPR